jgi:hypothetical protein
LSICLYLSGSDSFYYKTLIFFLQYFF